MINRNESRLIARERQNQSAQQRRVKRGQAAQKTPRSRLKLRPSPA